MLTFIYTTSNTSTIRGYNKTVTVYRIVKNKPVLIGIDEKIDTASYKGERACAFKLISDVLGFKMADGYRLLRQDVELIAI